MERTITLTIPSSWLGEKAVDQDELRQALMLGLAEIRHQQANPNVTERVVQVLLNTKRIRHLSAALVKDKETDTDRQVPPVLSGPPVSEILIAQQRRQMI